MSILLSLDTSTKVCSVALHSNENLLASFEVFVEKSHSKIITSLVEQLLKDTGLVYHDLDAIAVAKGPGSYTGLRIGVSTAKGLCYALGKPLIGVNTLQAMAESIRKYVNPEVLLCPMLDARRMEVYTATFDYYLNYIEETNSKILTEEVVVSDYLGKKICCFGDGAFKLIESLSNKESIMFIDGIYPSARNIGAIAVREFENNRVEELAYFEPFYLKDFMLKPNA